MLFKSALPKSSTSRFLVALGFVAVLSACGSDSDAGEAASPATQAGFLFPIAEGELANWQDALADLIGPKYAEYESSRGRFGLTQQTTVLQETPMGNFALIYMEGPDLADTTQQMATSPESWDVEWREMTSGLHGADFNDPEAISTDAHLVLDTGNLSSLDKQDTSPMLFFIPLAQDSAGSIRAELQAIMDERADEYRAARSSIGVAEEKVFLQNTPVGPGLVVYWEAADPQDSLRQLLDSTDPFDEWFTTEFASYHGVPTNLMQDIWSQNQLVADFPARN